jgi:P-type Cu2+ transporter
MTDGQDLSHYVRRPVDGVAAMDLVVEGVHCGACVAAIESGLRKQTSVRGAGVNLASKRVTVEWNEGALEPPAILERLEALGYPAHPFVGQTAGSPEKAADSSCCAASASPLSPV